MGHLNGRDVHAAAAVDLGAITSQKSEYAGMRAALTLLLLPAALIALLAALLHSFAPQTPTVAFNMSASQHASTAVTSFSQHVRVAELPGKGRGLLATVDIPQGSLLWSELPLTSSPYPASSASQLTPQSAVDELALELLADPAGAYSLLCHHVEVQHASSPSDLLQPGVTPSSAVTMRQSPVAEWSDLQFSIAASQVQSNAFATRITAAEVEAIARGRKLHSHNTSNTAAEVEQQGEENQRSEVKRGTVAADSDSGASSARKKKAKKRAKQKSKQTSPPSTTPTTTSAISTPLAADSSQSSLQVLTLYVHISMLNHCCYPNAQVYWPAGSATDGWQSPRVYAISDVKAGEEVCISYRADLLHYPTLLRQSVINSSWHFHCTCDRCTRSELFPHDNELLGLQQPLSDEQQARMLQSFTVLASYADQLSASSNEVVLHPRMLRQLFDFLALPLSTAHWRRHRIRSLYLPLLLPQSTVSYGDKRRVLDEHITSNARILPPLHASKLQYLLTFVELVELEESGRSREDVMTELTTFEPHAVDIIRMYK